MRNVTLRQRVAGHVRGVTRVTGLVAGNFIMTGVVVVGVLLVMGRKAMFTDIPHHDSRDPRYGHY